MWMSSGEDREYHRGRRRYPSLAAVSLGLWVATFVGFLSDAPTLLSPCRANDGIMARSEAVGRNKSNTHGGDVPQTMGSRRNESFQEAPVFPKVAWLMSFPNSGTSYTLRIVRQITNQTTATNYGKEHLISSDGHVDNTVDEEDGTPDENAMDSNSKSGISILMQSNWTQGPFRANLSQALPEQFILTKTHCGSRCVHCAPDGYLETLRTFQRACLTGRRVDRNSDDNGTGTISTTTMYDPSMVARAVHLIRNPLDNIVARFHLSRRRDRNNQNVHYPNNSTGFQDWCHSLDRSYLQYETHTPWLDDTLLQLWKHVPCHAEFYKYIQWHNLAHLTTTSMMDIPVHILRYEDYASRDMTETWKGTVTSLLNFLKLPAVAWKDATPFDMHSYHHSEYYTTKQVSDISQLLQHVAAAPVWSMLVGPYFVSNGR